MKIVEREHIDIHKWDDLVALSKDATLFSLSHYLDAVAENWCVLVDENYSKGIALPYSIRLGIKCLYTPIFSRYTELLGGVDSKDILSYLQNYFPEANFSIKHSFSGFKGKEFVFQEIKELKLNQQAKRMLQKFQKADIEIKEVEEINGLVLYIEKELSEKVAVFDSASSSKMIDLVNSLKKQGVLKAFGFFEETKLVGGMLFLTFNNRVVYLKGAANATSKAKGVMYACMNNEIKEALASSKIFDFGGSRIEGVKRFNHSFGSADVVYYNYEWHMGPLWFKAIKGMRNLWIK